MKKLSIQHLSLEYIKEALDLQNRVFQEHSSMEYLQGVMENPSYEYFILLYEEHVIGLIYFLKGIYEAELINIGVDIAYRKRGFANGLMEKMFFGLKKCNISEIFLEVREGNTPAIALYKKFGFEAVGLRKDYYNNPKEHAILMKKDLI